jgi:rhamnosyltransferase subunit B
LLVTGYKSQTPVELPPSMRFVSYAPFSRLLPKTCAIVHHGGIGTTAQALAAGVPQLVMPLSHDQPDNARRVKRLGVGLTIDPRDFEPAAVARMIGTLTRNLAIQRSCKDTAARFSGPPALEKTADVLESLAGHSSSVSSPEVSA